MRQYPYTIDNGHGEQLTFTGVSHGPDGDRVGAEGVAQPGAGPPMHVHYLQEEGARVVTGRLGYQVRGEEAKFADVGDIVVWPAGTPHKWWNAGTTELRMTGWCKPPDNIEFFLGALFASAKENGGRPALFDAAFFITRYRSEFAMLELPAFVRRILIPILYGVGRVLGKHDKYRDAPEPITRQRPSPDSPGT
jgi:mannose-6-phosphate isomerase-like protein (cupin superfamily)